jgi:hypothetical protein
LAGEEPLSLGYEFRDEEEARAAATDLDRRFPATELKGLRVYRVRWSGNYLVEATFSPETARERMRDAQALLGESGAPVHPDDLEDYKRATGAGGSLPGWLRRFLSDG